MKADTALKINQKAFINDLEESYVDYYISDTTLDYDSGIVLNNGLYALPVGVLKNNSKPISDGTIYNIVKTGLTYYDRENIVYGNYITLFNETCEPNEDGNFEIDCSSFVLSLIQGISFENSRYTLGSNALNYGYSYGYKFEEGLPKSLMASSRKYGFLANEIAYYAFTHGFLYKINEDGSNVKPGDFIFQSNYRESERLGEFCRIGHCAFVVNQPVPSDSKFYIMQSGGSGENVQLTKFGNKGTVNFAIIDLNSPDANLPYTYGARFPFNEINDPTRIIGHKISSANVTRTSESEDILFLDSIELTEALEKGEVYTFLFKGRLDSLRDIDYPIIRIVSNTGGFIYNLVGNSVKYKNNTNYYRFIAAPLIDSNASSLTKYINFYNVIQTGSSIGSPNLNFNLEEIIVLKGIYTGSIDTFNFDSTFDTITSLDKGILKNNAHQIDISGSVSNAYGALANLWNSLPRNSSAFSYMRCIDLTESDGVWRKGANYFVQLHSLYKNYGKIILSGYSFVEETIIYINQTDVTGESLQAAQPLEDFKQPYAGIYYTKNYPFKNSFSQVQFISNIDLNDLNTDSGTHKYTGSSADCTNVPSNFPSSQPFLLEVIKCSPGGIILQRLTHGGGYRVWSRTYQGFDLKWTEWKEWNI